MSEASKVFEMVLDAYAYAQVTESCLALSQDSPFLYQQARKYSFLDEPNIWHNYDT